MSSFRSSIMQAHVDFLAWEKEGNHAISNNERAGHFHELIAMRYPDIAPRVDADYCREFLTRFDELAHMTGAEDAQELEQKLRGRRAHAAYDDFRKLHTQDTTENVESLAFHAFVTCHPKHSNELPDFTEEQAEAIIHAQSRQRLLRKAYQEFRPHRPRFASLEKEAAAFRSFLSAHYPEPLAGLGQEKAEAFIEAAMQQKAEASARKVGALIHGAALVLGMAGLDPQRDEKPLPEPPHNDAPADMRQRPSSWREDVKKDAPSKRMGR